MPYATIQDFLLLTHDSDLIEGSNLDDPQAMVLDNDRLNKALIAASNKINASLAISFAVPNLVLANPPDLTRICVRIAHFELEGLEIREVVQKKYDAAIADLNNYRAGAIALIDSNGNPIQPNPGTEISGESVGGNIFVAQRRSLWRP
jgi:phage gp36-like protein